MRVSCRSAFAGERVVCFPDDAVRWESLCRLQSRRGFGVAAELAGVRDVSLHSMRHAFASRMIDRGISSTVLASLMGHESSTITERRYIHLYDKQRTDEQVRQAMGI